MTIHKRAQLVCLHSIVHDEDMTSNVQRTAPRDDSAILWNRLFRLWAVMSVVWAFMGVWSTGLACSLGGWSAQWCTGATLLSGGEIVYEMIGLPLFFLVSGLLLRGMLMGTRALSRRVVTASAGRSSRSR
jgi:hypothetical protein